MSVSVSAKTARMRTIALENIARGFVVFPLQEDSSEPIVSIPRRSLLTSDPAEVERLWSAPFNVGVDCEASNLVVIDADRHDPTVDGLRGLVIADVPLDTFTVETPGQGLHLYFKGPVVQSGASVLAPGVDIRSHAGYVVAAGCPRVSEKRGYTGQTYRIVADTPLGTLPADIRARLRPPRPRDREESGVEFTGNLDTPESIHQATAYLEGPAGMAIHGFGRSHQVFKVAARLGDWGVSCETATRLILEIYNPAKVQPSYPDSRIQEIVRNAYAYRAKSVGSDSVEAHFDGVQLPPELAEAPPTATPPVSAEGFIKFGRYMPLDALPPRPWVMRPFLVRKHVTMLVANGAAGKSTLLFWWAACIARGVDWEGHPVQSPGKVILFSAEDDYEEMMRRMWAFCILHNLDAEVVMKNIAVVPGDELIIKISRGATGEVDRRYLAAFAMRCRAEGVVFVGFDPLSTVHESDENSNSAMSKVASALKMIALDANCAVGVVHHTKKGYGRFNSAAGDADAGRGAGGIVTSARINLTLVEATDADVKEYNLDKRTRSDYVRLDGAKVNLTRKGGDEPLWFKRRGVTLGNGDESVALEGVKIADTGNKYRTDLVTMLEGVMDEANVFAMTSYKAAEMLQALDPLLAQENIRTVQNRLHAMLKEPVKTGRGTMRTRLVQEGKGTVMKVVLE